MTAPQSAEPSRFNVSRWALEHPALTRYLLIVLMALKPRAKNPRGIRVQELFAEPPEKVRVWHRNPTGRFAGKVLLCIDKILRVLESRLPKRRRARAIASAMAFIEERLNGVDGLGGIFPAMVNAVCAMEALGYAKDDRRLVVAKNSIESVGAREADVLTTVSEITAKETTVLLGRTPQPITPNGLDLAVIDEMAGKTPRDQARTTLIHTASRFFGEDVSDAAFLAISGRYEFHNKGIELLLDALGNMQGGNGRGVVAFVLAIVSCLLSAVAIWMAAPRKVRTVPGRTATV